jgi:hypothetical protein
MFDLFNRRRFDLSTQSLPRGFLLCAHHGLSFGQRRQIHFAIGQLPRDLRHGSQNSSRLDPPVGGAFGITIRTQPFEQARIASFQLKPPFIGQTNELQNLVGDPSFFPRQRFQFEFEFLIRH